MNMNDDQPKDPSADFYAMVQMFNNPASDFVKLMESRLYYVRQVALGSDGKTLYEGAPKAHIEDRRKAAGYLLDFAQELVKDLNK